ncbi:MULTISPECIES: hypothetical protein [Massilia]|jgi:hypothetical protein|uniref:Uncharacterized protein n=8 Tax=Massilia TaxID=149698 RepID=A0ABY4A1D5_9BURK|nr:MULTISPECIES: hypothetical protein [Massilia]CUI08290.1 hypothetical protein BN2497_11357 [Janthinobacterium sp. CG23_2]MCE3604850.1 hypothetical protein [Massilia antarctica]MCY0914681.1 hypothetical protein [Massilia sp. H27-R4]NHZ37405.1 hypothetical protein [Massilia rubra]NHZ40982.1 hypothetical protein [Massilia aquatica]
MRSAFEAWAQRDGHIVRRREDKPDEYLVFETQRRWVIWQAALAHGKTAAATAKYSAQKAASKESAEPVRASAPASDETAVRNRVLNEVLDAFSDLDDTAGIEGVLKVIQGLKKKQKALAEDKTES